VTKTLFPFLIVVLLLAALFLASGLVQVISGYRELLP
jgi:hypothetical protein